MQKYLIILFFLSLFSCKDTRKEELQNSPSTYIQQHANDPVNWHIWSEDIYDNAKKLNKIVLISIGYSACHWCHVMQHESFQNEEIAKIMNANYYCVKIDREEHPNIDAYFAKKQEELTGWAGWPMHFILNENKEIIWTGIYLNPKRWKNLIFKIAEEYKQNPDLKLIETNIIIKEKSNNKTLNIDSINKILIHKLDTINGGLIPTHYSRKYPMTSLLNYLLKIYRKNKNIELGKFLKLTANKMAMGGMNDQIEGGFFRFSMDDIWHIPHFEKMLYTNTNLINFYINAFETFKDSSYLHIAENTAMFIKKNFKSKNALFFGSMDADQNGEGSYYLFSNSKIKNVLGNDFELANNYYNLNESWKYKGKYHLYCSYSDKLFAEKINIPLEKWKEKKDNINAKLFSLRKKKTKPKIDAKLISSWNALLLESFANLYKATNNKQYYTDAEHIATFFINKYKKNKTIKHFYLEDKKSYANTYAEDLLYTSKAFCKLFELNKSNKKYLNFALLIYKQYLKNKDSFLIFPFDDRNTPSANATEIFIVKFLNSEMNANFKMPIIDISKINEHPEFYGNVLFESLN